MIIKSTKLRRLTLTLQFLAGVALLTASYLTTDQNWTNDFLEAAIPSAHSAVNKALCVLINYHR